MRDESVGIVSAATKPIRVYPRRRKRSRTSFRVVSLGVIYGWKCRGRENLSHSRIIRCRYPSNSRRLPCGPCSTTRHQIGSVEHDRSRITSRNIGEPFDIAASEVLRILRRSERRCHAPSCMSRTKFQRRSSSWHRNSRHLSVIRFHAASPFVFGGSLTRQNHVSQGFRSGFQARERTAQKECGSSSNKRWHGDHVENPLRTPLQRKKQPAD